MEREKMLTKSWVLTIVLYGFSLASIFAEMFYGVHISNEAMTLMLSLVGISTTAGTTNAVLANKDAIKKIIADLIQTQKEIQKN